MGCVGSAAEHALGGGRGVLLNKFWKRRYLFMAPQRESEICLVTIVCRENSGESFERERILVMIH